MGLRVSDIKEIVLKNGQGVDISLKIEQAFKALVENDNGCMISENSISPKIWECKWLLTPNDKTQYYNKGDAVWLNTDTEDMILASRINEISAYVTSHPKLSLQYEKINKDDTDAVNTYFKSVINGTACRGVSALYYLGDITKAAQIKVSKKDYNSDYPNISSSWYDFYIPITEQDCISAIDESLSNCIQEQFGQHIVDYHGLDISQKTVSDKYLLKNSYAIKQDTKKQYFYNHSFFKDMNGFDYVISQKFDGYNWYRLWNSGYLEQGGYVVNDNNDIIRVEFLLEYNYPQSINFYQTGYDKYNGQEVEGTIDFSKRYCATVTPMVTEGVNPYGIGPKDTNGNKTYACTDITDMDNNGFSFVNVDTENKYYNIYCYQVCGFRTVTNENGDNKTDITKIHTVNFFDTKA